MNIVTPQVSMEVTDNSDSFRNPMADAELLQIQETRVLRNASSAVMLQPGFTRNGSESKVRQIQKCFSISAVGKKCLDPFVSEEKSSNY